ncbi:hypothetical protein BJ912DRAFT_850916 [Pholiota molesta]|nr:hypothetical protein BJ912DRAFT_850916 [Pholiota molesta]
MPIQVPFLPCPRCGKKFATTARRLNHLNQPYSSCLTHFDEQVRIKKTLLNARPTPVSTTQVLEPNFSPDIFMEDVSIHGPLVSNPSEEASLDSNIPPPKNTFFKTTFSGASQTYGLGPTFMDRFDQDRFAPERKTNLYYPFASEEEWEFASYLLRSDLSVAAIDKLLKLRMTQGLSLSFNTAKDLRNRAEMLPTGPVWRSRVLKPVYPTKNTPTLYYRNPVECLESLLRNPLLEGSIEYTPFQLFETAEKKMRVYTEWLSGDAAWSMQKKIAPGATLLGTVLSSDKTNISAMTGNRLAHPLLISLANINMGTRNKSSNHLFLLLALLPIPHFTHHKQKMRGVLDSRLFHESLDFILAPLKKAAEIGVMMTDPLGWQPSTTIAQLQEVESIAHPWNLDSYVVEAMKFRLNGVHRPFWRDFPLSDPSTFLTPEPLHHWHKQFWDHDAKWCINALTGPEIDFRFSVLHPHTAFRHFKEGISSLKQVTGREHRDVQRYIVAIIAGAVTPGFLVTIRSLIDFRYLAQSSVITDDTCSKIEHALGEFHSHKQAILDAKARRGKKFPIENWHIPKLEFMQSVVTNIRSSGVSVQWSADVTEHAHIEVVKDPAHSGNNQNYEPQICRYLDRLDKLRQFDLATSIRDSRIDFRDPAICLDVSDDSVDNIEVTTAYSNINTTHDLLDNISSVSPLIGATRTTVDYFQLSLRLKSGLTPSAPFPYRTHQCSPHSAFHLTRDASYKRMSIKDVSTLFDIPDLHAALGDYVRYLSLGKTTFSVGGRRTSSMTCVLQFSELDVWNRVRVQTRTYHHPHMVLAPYTINAYPPSPNWPLGQYDSAIINTDTMQEWPKSGLNGHLVVDVRLIFRIVSNPSSKLFGIPDQFIMYVQRFDVVPQINQSISGSRTLRGSFPDPSSSLYILKRSKRSDGTLLGDIIPLSQIRTLVDRIPCFGAEADRRLTSQNSTTYSSEYFLNKYFDKEMFWALN